MNSFTAKTVHDYKLKQQGSGTHGHSVNYKSYDERLDRIKKYNTLNREEVQLDDFEILGTDKEMDQYVRLCSGEDLRKRKILDKLYCKYEHRHKPYYRYEFLDSMK